MKKLAAVIVVLAFSLVQYAFACTTFFINKNGQLVFGRNYDWITSAGMICTNLKGLAKTSAQNEPGGNSITWISKYGSITFNQYGKEFPTGGMNETGLVVELMWADGSNYPKPDNRPALGVLQWIQFLLDNYSSVEEVISSDSKIRISPNNPPLHYLTADASGNVATIEFLDGKMVVHRGSELPFPVLTNSPYDQSVKTANESNVLSGNPSMNFQDNSLVRFTKACSMVNSFQVKDIKKPVIDFAFEVLDTVSQKEFTKWSIVYDLKNKTVYFKTVNYPDIKYVSFKTFDFQCPAVSKVLNMNQPIKGDVNSDFKNFNEDINRAVLDKAIKESKTQIPLTEKDEDGFILYANSVQCKN
jgi:penicillin V acylase-like amidase (Ntn superfamily)